MDILNGVDVLGLHYLNGQPESYELNQQFWKYNYSVSSKRIIQNLTDNNFIELRTEPKQSLKNLTVEQLKDILRKNNLKVSGNKSVLIKRIVEGLPEEELSEKLEKVWSPTEKGKKLIEQTDFIRVTHNKLNYLVSINDVYRIYLENPSLSSKNILITAIENKIKFKGNTEYHVNIPHALLEISRVCNEYEDFDGQFDYLIRAIVSKFSLSDNGYNRDYIMESYNFFFPNYQIQEMFIRDLKNLIYSNENYKVELKNKIQQYYNSKTIKHFTAKDIYQIVMAYMNEDEEQVTELYKKVFRKNGGTNFSDDFSYQRTIKIDLNQGSEKPKSSKQVSSRNNSGCGCLIPLILMISIIPLFITLL